MVTTTQVPAQTRARLVPVIGVALIVVALTSAAIGLISAGGGYLPAPVGLPDPGPVVAWGALILRVLTDLAAITTIGFILAAAVLDPSGKGGVVSRIGRADIRRAGVAAWIWAVLALAQFVFVLADVLAVPLATAASPEVVSTYANALPTTRALMAMAVLAIVVAIGLTFTATVGPAAGWLILAIVAAMLPSLAGHGQGLGDHALAQTSNVIHAVAAMVWIGGLLALGTHAARRTQDLRRPAERFGAIAAICLALMALSGFANAYTRLESPQQLLTTGYGQVLLAKIAVLVGLSFIAFSMRTRVVASLGARGRANVFARVAGIELALMSIAVGLGVALATSPPLRAETQFASIGEQMLGFAYPPPPTIANVGMGFRFDALFLLGSLLVASLYCIGVAKLVARGDKWPVGRVFAFLTGIGIIIWCTGAGIATYSQVSVGLHMLQHMTLTMLGPLFLVLGAPATLALRVLRPARAGERGPREWLVWFLHSWITGIVTNPFFVFVIYLTGLYGLYMTPAFGWLMGSHIGHVVMQLHFILSGYLLAWILVGVDPRPKPLPYWGRLLFLLVALGMHGFFAVALMSATTPLAPEWYGLVRPDWVSDPLADSLFGGQVAWGLSELPTIILIVVIAIQWSRSDDREATRNDRQADRDGDAELEAYNARLNKMSERDR